MSCLLQSNNSVILGTIPTTPSLIVIVLKIHKTPAVTVQLLDPVNYRGSHAKSMD